MKNIPAKNIQRIIFITAMLLGLNLTTTTLFAQDAVASEKIQLMSEALHARDTGDLLLAKEKVEKLIALAPNDKNMQALLITINQSIEDKGLIVPNDETEPESEVEAEAEEKVSLEVESKPSLLNFINRKTTSKELLPVEEVSPIYVAQKETVDKLLVVANSQICLLYTSPSPRD